MDYVLAVLLPPAAVWRRGPRSQRARSVALTLLGFLPGVVHACRIVSQSAADDRRHRPKLGRPNPFGLN